jgi:arylsulfatase A-like enzyme
VPKDIDGLSIVPTLLGKKGKQPQHDYLYWAFYERGGAQAALAGRWKAVQQPLNTPLRLYDLSADIGEEHDVAGGHPDIAAKLTESMRAAYQPNENWRFPDPPAGKAKAKAKAKAP